MHEEYLIEVDELQKLIQEDSVSVIDTRSPEAFNEAHIPGAVNIHEIFTYLVTAQSGGLDAMVKQYKELFESAGIRKTDKVVLYEDAMDNGYGQSCRGRFIMNYLGHENVRALHGGYRAWCAKGLPLTDEKTSVKRSVYDVQINPAEMLTSDDILEAIGDPNIKLLDCRDYAEWVGVTSSPYALDFSPRKGRIPGAVWIEWYQMMYHKDGIPWIKSKQEILEICEEVGIKADTKVYIYCFKGARASNTLIALKIAGIKDVRNYIGSWHDWALNPDLPIDEDYPKS